MKCPCGKIAYENKWKHNVRHKIGDPNTNRTQRNESTRYEEGAVDECGDGPMLLPCYEDSLADIVPNHNMQKLLLQTTYARSTDSLKNRSSSPSEGLSPERFPCRPPQLVIEAPPGNEAYFSRRPPLMPLMLVVRPQNSYSQTDIATQTVSQSKLTQNCDTEVQIIVDDLEGLVKDGIKDTRESAAMEAATDVCSRKSRAVHRSHNVAVQAVMNNGEKRSSQSCRGNSPPHTPVEWVGGVRALRDMQVRLVLRQLRNIKRLNRALDSVVLPSNKK